MHSPLRVSQLVLAGLVFLIAVITASTVPQPYPTWPTIGPVPVNPELVVPGLLGLLAVLGAFREGFSLVSVVAGGLGVVTMGFAFLSLYTLYSGIAGGVFWGGFYTLSSGVILALVVVIQSVSRLNHRRNLILRIHTQFRE